MDGKYLLFEKSGVKKAIYFVNELLNKPSWVLVICISAVLVQMMFGGAFLRMLHLYNSQRALENRITDIQVKNSLVEEKLKKLQSDPRFLEREVRSRFNLVGEEDIIFIFSDEN